MGNPKEVDRPWEVIGDHIHLDKRIYESLREPVIEAVGRIREKTGVEHIEVIPWQWELDSNLSSIAIRGETPKGPVHEIFDVRCKEQLVLTLKTQLVPTLSATNPK